MKHKVNLRETEPGVVEFDTWPSKAKHLLVMVYNQQGQQTCWGRWIYPTDKWRIHLKSAAKRRYNQVELWTDFWGDSRTEMIGFGEYKPEVKKQKWAETAIEYKKLANHYRKRAAVHQSLANKAKLHMRPVGNKAHLETVAAFKDVEEIYLRAIAQKKTLPVKIIEDLKKEEAKIHQRACQKDGVFPPHPAQKWYRSPRGEVHMKAKFQTGFDRRPHILILKGQSFEFRYHGMKKMTGVSWCSDLNWNEVNRGQAAWKPLRMLRTPIGKEGHEYRNIIYLKVGKDITVFNVP